MTGKHFPSYASHRTGWKLNQSIVLHLLILDTSSIYLLIQTLFLWIYMYFLYTCVCVCVCCVLWKERDGIKGTQQTWIEYSYFPTIFKFLLEIKRLHGLNSTLISDRLQRNIIRMLKKFLRMEILKMNCLQVLVCSLLKVTLKISASCISNKWLRQFPKECNWFFIHWNACTKAGYFLKDKLEFKQMQVISVKSVQLLFSKMSRLEDNPLFALKHILTAPSFVVCAQICRFSLRLPQIP